MANVPKNFNRTLPFLKILHKSKPGVNKIELLKKFPDFVINDLIELLYNILVGNVNIKPKQKKALSKHKKTVYKFASLPSLKSRRNFIYKQKGGFLTTILPIIASLIGGLAS
jgi:hypothetical protein